MEDAPTRKEKISHVHKERVREAHRIVLITI